MPILQLALQLLLTVSLPIVLVAAVGWVVDRKFRLDLNTLTKINLYVMVPAFVFVRITTAKLDAVSPWQPVIFTLEMLLLLAFFSWMAAKWLGLDPAGGKALQLGMFYNCGNYGVPLMRLTYGPQAEAIQVFVLLTMNIATFTFGTFLAHGQGKLLAAGEDKVPLTESRWRSLLPLLRQPSIYAVALALLVRGQDWPVDRVTWLWEPLRMLADGLVGFALLTLGVQMSRTSHGVFDRRLPVLLVIKLLLAPLLAVGLVWLHQIPREVAAGLILVTGAPTAVNSALLAHEFKADSQFAAAAVFYSTLFSVVTVPLVLLALKLSYG